jgi:hypothetical protein
MANLNSSVVPKINQQDVTTLLLLVKRIAESDSSGASE